MGNLLFGGKLINIIQEQSVTLNLNSTNDPDSVHLSRSGEERFPWRPVGPKGLPELLFQPGQKHLRRYWIQALRLISHLAYLNNATFCVVQSNIRRWEYICGSDQDACSGHLFLVVNEFQKWTGANGYFIGLLLDTHQKEWFNRRASSTTKCCTTWH